MQTRASDSHEIRAPFVQPPGVFSSAELHKFVNIYETEAKLLCDLSDIRYHSSQGSFRSSRGLRSSYSGEIDGEYTILEGDERYYFWRPGTPGPEERPDSYAPYNLDFRTPIQLISEKDGERSETTIEDFLTGLVLALPPELTAGHEINESHIDAFSAAIRIEYEQGWLNHVRPGIEESAKAMPVDIEEVTAERLASFRKNAGEIMLREANLANLRSQMIESIRTAHGVARRYGDTTREMYERSAGFAGRDEHRPGFRLPAHHISSQKLREWSREAPSDRVDLDAGPPKGILKLRLYPEEVQQAVTASVLEQLHPE